MRRRTFHLLQATFTLAVAACRDPSAGSGRPAPSASTSAPPSTASAPPAAPTTTVTAEPTSRRPGQRCTGALVAGLRPSEPVDYLALRLDYYPQGSHEVVLAGPKGAACARAKDAAACAAALASARPKPGVGEYLVYTRGDEAGVVGGRAVGRFLAPIETAEEAAMTLTYALAEGTSAAAVLPPCDAAAFTKTAEGFTTTHTTRGFCGEEHASTYLVAPDGAVSTTGSKDTPPRPGCQQPTRGRRPEGLVLAARDDAATLGGFFAECTEMEAASVVAFRRLDVELAALGAPRSLRAQARRSAVDEARHARAMRRLARRYDARPRRPRVRRAETRAVVDLAVENMREGCVFETWAALLATWQAERAAEAPVRDALAAIAVDETRHAALAWDLAAWLAPRLTEAEADRVDRAFEAALVELSASALVEPPEALREVAGVPSASDARALLDALRATLEALRSGVHDARGAAVSAPCTA